MSRSTPLGADPGPTSRGEEPGTGSQPEIQDPGGEIYTRFGRPDDWYWLGRCRFEELKEREHLGPGSWIFRVFGPIRSNLRMLYTILLGREGLGSARLLSFEGWGLSVYRRVPK